MAEKEDDLKSKIDLAKVYMHKERMIQLRLHLESFSFTLLLVVIGILIGILTNFFAFSIINYFNIGSFYVLIFSSSLLGILSIYLINRYKELILFINSINYLLGAGSKATMELDELLKKNESKKKKLNNNYTF